MNNNPTTSPHLPKSLPPSLRVPPLPPQIHQSVWISCDESGLLVRNVSWAQDANKGGVRIGWGVKGGVSVLESGDVSESGKEEIEVKGLLGLVRMWSVSYLLVIVEPKQVGSFPNPSHPVYQITNVQPIPLFLSRAQESISKLQTVIRHIRAHGSSPEEPTPSTARPGEVQTPAVEKEPVQEEDDKEGKRKSLNPFNWGPFLKTGSPAGSTTTSSAVPTQTSTPQPSTEQTPVPPGIPTLQPTSVDPPPSRNAIEKKILASLLSQYSSGQMFFSYDVDLTTSLNVKQAKLGGFPTDGEDRALVEPLLHLPLWRRVERRFWWNEWLTRELVDAGLHSYVLPVMQGWVQTSTFNLLRSSPISTSASTSTLDTSSSEEDEGGDEEVKPKEAETVSVQFTVISRRSRDRAGLRYQRRGIDDEGDVANFVETEQIVQTEGHTFSYIQIRGSIPLFWSQSPYTTSALALKPAPVLDRPLEDATGPMAVHFDALKKLYGPQTVVSLSELEGKEALVTNGYRDILASLGRDDVQYTQFDFHHECKGMKFENVSKLVHQLDKTFSTQGYFELGPKTRYQDGAFRTNCIDCLDRTNVVQSAFARQVLITQLASIGLTNIPQPSKSALDKIFNNVWANNGDSISRAYAGTSALKGDFTRTGTRNLHGMINDGLNSLARMYSSSFTDFFAQAVISFMLGQRSITIFTEFMETLQVSEPSSLLRLSIIRTEAIETCTARVINDETRQAGWTMFSPIEPNKTIGSSFEEKVLLLTEQALYVCSYEFQLEKVVGFTRIPLGSVLGIQHGEYILSPLQESGKDPEENYGFKIIYENTDEASTRLTSYSVQNRPVLPSRSTSSSSLSADLPDTPKSQKPKRGLKPFLASALPSKPPSEPPRRPQTFFAFKAIPRDLLLHKRNRPDLAYSKAQGDDGLDDGHKCREFVEGVVGNIRVACSEAGSGFDSMREPGAKFVEVKSVVSVEEAEKEVSLVQRFEYGIKRFLWL